MFLTFNVVPMVYDMKHYMKVLMHEFGSKSIVLNVKYNYNVKQHILANLN